MIRKKNENSGCNVVGLRSTFLSILKMFEQEFSLNDGIVPEDETASDLNYGHFSGGSRGGSGVSFDHPPSPPHFFAYPIELNN